MEYHEHVRAKGGDPRTFFGKLFGQEKDLATSSVARMNLLPHCVEDTQVERGDTLCNPMFTDPATGGHAAFDLVIANPPFSLRQWDQTFEDVEDHCRVIRLDEIEQENSTPNISRYMLPPIGKDIPQLPEALADFKATLERVPEAEEAWRHEMEEAG